MTTTVTDKAIAVSIPGTENNPEIYGPIGDGASVADSPFSLTKLEENGNSEMHNVACNRFSYLSRCLSFLEKKTSLEL